MKPAPDITIIIDTREQDPLRFTLPVERGTLTTGDYSMKGLERFIGIERKSPDDLTGCLKNGQRERFERELSRGRGLDYFALVVEADMSALAAGEYRSAMLPKAVMQSLLCFSVRYRLPIFFCPGRAYAARVIESLLIKYATEVEKRYEALMGIKKGENQ
jgi:ERCC4-type nuclease